MQNKLEVIFRDTGVTILVCGFNPRDASGQKKSVACYIDRSGLCYRGSGVPIKEGQRLFWDNLEEGGSATIQNILADDISHVGRHNPL